MTTGIITRTESCSGGQKSPQPISFHISHYYSSTSSPPPFKKRNHLTVSLSVSVAVRLISMSGTGGFADDSRANKRRPPLVTLPFPPRYGSMRARWMEGDLHPPIPRREDGEKRKPGADINAFSSRNATRSPPRLPPHLPGTWVGGVGAQTSPVNKSARGLNTGEAVIKPRPGAIAREMSGNLTERRWQEISRRKHALAGHEIAAEETLLCLWVLIKYLRCHALG